MSAQIAKVVLGFNTGGGCLVDRLYLHDGRVLELSEECAVLYPSVDALNAPPEDVQHFPHLDLYQPNEVERRSPAYDDSHRGGEAHPDFGGPQ